MKAYLTTTGLIFLLITGLHIWRACAEGPQLTRDSLFIALTALAGSMALMGLGVC